MIDIQLTYNAVYKWKTIVPISIIGYAFLNDDLLNEIELITYFSEANNEAIFVEKLRKLSGHFEATRIKYVHPYYWSAFYLSVLN